MPHPPKPPIPAPRPTRPSAWVRRATGRLLLVALTGALALVACSGGDGTDDGGARRWKAYNRERTGWTTEGRRAVEAGAARLAQRLGCGPLAGENFDAWAITYRRNGLPLPLAAGTCDLETGDPSGEPEVVLLEAFGPRPPTATDAVAARADLICATATRRGLPGQPWVLTRDRVLIQPDRPDTARRIAALFPGSRVGDVCPAASRRFFARPSTTTTSTSTSTTAAPAAPAPGGTP